MIKSDAQSTKESQSSMRKEILDLDVFLMFDYSQVEVRSLAEISGDPLLIKQFRSGEDIHSLVGVALTGWPVEKIKKDHDVRRSVKTFHFALIFGCGEDTMLGRFQAQGIKTTRQTIHQYFVNYFKTYKGVAKWIEKIRYQAETKGYVETLFGFRRYVPQHDETRGSYWANIAINSPIQGSAHQLTLIALALLDLKPRTFDLLQCPLMEIHDALLFRTKLRDLIKTFAQGKQLLEHSVVDYTKRNFGITLQVPLVAEAKAGFCFGSMVDYNGGPIKEFLSNWRKKHQEVDAASWEELYKM